MIRNCIYSVIALLILSGVWYYGHTRYAAGQFAGSTAVAELTAKHAVELQHLAELATTASEAARAAERQQAVAFASAAAQYERDKAHAQEQADRVIADLRAGTLRLRKQWTCPRASDAAEKAASSGQPDGDANLRAEGAADLVRLAAQCDAQIRGLQAIVREAPDAQR